MTFLSHVKELFAGSAERDEPGIAVFGDSHTAALQRARDVDNRQHHYEHIQIVRLRKEKQGKTVGDADLAAFCEMIEKFKPSDFVFSAVGGNQYAVISTVQEPIDYDFLLSPLDEDIVSERSRLIPHRAIAGFIEAGVRGNIGPVLQKIREATGAKVFHLAPPPPKQDNDFIARHFESRFAEDRIDELGPARPQLRLKCWKVQLEALAKLCESLEIELIRPPGKCVTPEGFLKTHYYAKDVTHGNRRYGETVLKQILKISGTSSKAEAKPQ